MEQLQGFKQEDCQGFAEAFAELNE